MPTCAAIAAIGLLAILPPQEDGWKITRIDANTKEEFRCLRVDTLGRLFVGGRDALFVHEPGDGGYKTRRLLQRFPPKSPINDIEIRGDDVFVLTSTALYIFPDGARKRDDVTPRKLLWGVPGGNVLRALAWGLEGDLYIAFGNPAGTERLSAWTFFNAADRRTTPYRGPGGILRCNPDGSDVRIVALGLRDPGAMTFDRYWNLFATDVAKEGAARLWHVTPHADLGRSRLPLLDDVSPALGCDGDVIGANADGLTRLILEPKGTGFEAKAVPLVACKQARAIAAGAGRIFAIEASGDVVAFTPREHSFAPYDAREAAAEKLWQELGDASWPRRYRAHIEIMRRGGAFLKEANQRIFQAKPNDPALHHLIWLAAKSGLGSPHLLGCVSHADWRVRVQALRALAEFPEQLREEPIFTRALLDDNPQVQLAALSALLSPKVGWDRAVQFTVERGPACSDDVRLRQTAALVLAHKATRKQLEDLCASAEAAKRLAGVLAIGYRLVPPGSTAPFYSHLPLRPFADESAYVIEYADGKVDLRDRGRLGTYTIAEHWQADKHADEVHQLLKVMERMTKDKDARVRGEALRFVSRLR